MSGELQLARARARAGGGRKGIIKRGMENDDKFR